MSNTEFFNRYPHWFCFIFSGVFLIGAIFNFASAEKSRSYLQTSGDICHLEEVTVTRHRHLETRYDFDVVWKEDGIEYSVHMDKQVDCPKEGASTIWVSPDHKSIRLSSPEDIQKEAPKDLLFSLLTGIAGILFLLRKRVKSNTS